MSSVLERGKLEELLLNACWRGDETSVRDLIAQGANIDVVSDSGWTALGWATCRDRANIVRILLDAKAYTEIGDLEGATPLHRACDNGNLEIIRLLLEAEASIHAEDNRGDRPIHRVLSSWTISLERLCDVVFELVHYGAYWDARCIALAEGDGQKVALGLCVDFWVEQRSANQPLLTVPAKLIEGGPVIIKQHLERNQEDRFQNNGNSSLHEACLETNLDMVRVLLETGADVNATNAYGHKPIHAALKHKPFANPIEAHSVLFVLVSFGAEWDDLCTQQCMNQYTIERAAGWRRCVQWWADRRQKCQPLIEVPLEVVDQGTAALDEYIRELDRMSAMGPTTTNHSAWLENPTPTNATNFTFTDTTFTPAYLTDNYVIEPTEPLPPTDGPTLHRRIYLMGATNSGRTSLTKSVVAETPTLDQDADKSTAFNVESRTLTFAGYHSSAELHQLTMVDVTGDEHTRMTAGAMFLTRRAVVAVCVDLSAFAAVMETGTPTEIDAFIQSSVVAWIDMAQRHQAHPEIAIIATKSDLVGDANANLLALKKAVKKHHNALPDTIAWLVVSCLNPVDVLQARAQLETLVIKSNRSVRVESEDVEAVDAIATLQRDATRLTGTQRVAVAVQPFEELQTMTGSCSIETLYHASGLLWFELEGVELLHNTAFVDPSLLAELVRPLTTEYDVTNGELMPHATLVTLPVWRDLDQNLLLAMKQLLCYFGVVYSVDEEIAWDSDLLMPAAWCRTVGTAEDADDTEEQQEQGEQDALPAVYLTGTAQYQPSAHVHWQFQVTQPLPASFFDRLAVKTHSPMCTREIDRQTITYRPSSSFVCAVTVTRDAIHLQAVALKTEMVMWWIFSHLGLSIEKLLATEPDLVVSRTARNSQRQSIRLETAVASWANSPPKFRATINWLPPDLEWYLEFMGPRSK